MLGAHLKMVLELILPVKLLISKLNIVKLFMLEFHKFKNYFFEANVLNINFNLELILDYNINRSQ